MNLEQLTTFLWVARLQGFAAAAEKLNTTQPGVSNRIKALEGELGVTLFNRTTRTVRLTPEGRRCLLLVEELVSLVGQIKDKIGSREKITGVFCLGVSEAVAMSIFPELVSELRQAFPRVEIQVEVGVTRTLLAQLRSGSVDAVLAGGMEDRPLHSAVDRLGAIPLFKMEYSWFRSPHLHLPSTEPLSIEELSALPIINYSKQAIMADGINHWLHQGRRSNHVICDSFSAVFELVKNGLGVGLLPRRIYARAVHAGTIAKVETSPRFPLVRYYAIYRLQNDSLFLADFLEIVREVSERAGFSDEVGPEG